MKTQFKPLLVGLLFTAGSLKAQQPPPMQPPSPEARLKQVTTRLSKDLSLKPLQKQKVQAAYKTFIAGMKKLRASGRPMQPPPPPPPRPRRSPVNMEAMDKLVKTRDASIKKALTEAQYKKYQQIEKSMRPDRRGPGGPGDRRMAGRPGMGRPGSPDGRRGGPEGPGRRMDRPGPGGPDGRRGGPEGPPDHRMDRPGPGGPDGPGDRPRTEDRRMDRPGPNGPGGPDGRRPRPGGPDGRPDGRQGRPDGQKPAGADTTHAKGK